MKSGLTDWSAKQGKRHTMEALAVVLHEPERLELSRLALTAPCDTDVVVDVEFSGISTGTEKLLWQGTMPSFPGMGYPLVPGYESVGRISAASSATHLKPGQRVFVPGAKCFGDIRGLFGGAASRLVVPASRVIPIAESMGEQGVLLALAATAHHAAPQDALQPDLIIGHGVLGRLIARLVIASGAQPPTVWEINPERTDGADGYDVIPPDADTRKDYRCICDASGDASLLDRLIGRMAPGGEIILAGFYTDRMSFAFAPAFMREMRLRIAAQFVPSDITAVQALVEAGRLSLDGLITHHHDPRDATTAYRTAFTRPDCLKMVLNWSQIA
jgi:3-hydroxyethyl bacteriochlorophyllide a dehydrogenase